MIIAGQADRLVSALAALALFVVSLPTLIYRDGSAVHALSTFIASVQRTRGRHGNSDLRVPALLVSGSIPPGLGLIGVLACLGYSTWHLYLKLLPTT
jgi:uncharacterized membrane protein